MPGPDFTETLWNLDEQQLIKNFVTYSGRRDTGDAHTALTILQAKAAVAAKDTAKATRQLAYATFALAALTLALVLVQVFDVKF
jgi:hypothetical protein